MPDHRIEAPSAVGLPPPSELVVEGWANLRAMIQVQAGDRVILVVGHEEFVYHCDGEGKLVRAHDLVDCWCGGSR